MKLSVCIAAYQGERFIAAQLASILAQLSTQDEVIVVDDHSTDRTCHEVSSFDDSRILLLPNDKNEGVAKSFEKAISRSSGEVVFLSDQDDLWVPGKVERVLQVFKSQPAVTLIVSDALLIDEEGIPRGRYYAQRGTFRSGLFANLIRCKYLGCTMAFRSELIAKVIPFPTGSDVLHDIWIGVVNSISSGTTYYLDEPLVCYRRHSAAVTGSHLNLRRKITIRLHLVKAVLNLYARTALRRCAGTEHVL